MSLRQLHKNTTSLEVANSKPRGGRKSLSNSTLPELNTSVPSTPSTPLLVGYTLRKRNQATGPEKSQFLNKLVKEVEIYFKHIGIGKESDEGDKYCNPNVFKCGTNYGEFWGS
jgi:hypothetical protein